MSRTFIIDPTTKIVSDSNLLLDLDRELQAPGSNRGTLLAEVFATRYGDDSTARDNESDQWGFA